MFITLIVVHVIASISLVIIVLLQTGKGAELGAAFGGVGQATTTRGQYTLVHKVTTALAIIFMSTSLSLAFISTERPRTSLLAPEETSSAPAPQAPAAPQTAPAPAESAPAGGSPSQQ